MNLTQIVLEEVQENPSIIKELLEEAHKYGIHRGECSAVGDRYGLMGGPSFDAVLEDYLKEKVKHRNQQQEY